MSETLLTIEGLRKAYPGVVANDDVSFSISAGRGPCPAGRERRRQVDAGQDDLRAGAARRGADDVERASRMQPATPHAARAAGVGDGVPALLALRGAERGRERGAGHGKPADMQRSWRSASARCPRPTACRWTRTALVGDLSVGERQRVEIVRCLLQDPKLLIMDEPTSVLTPQEVGILFETLRKLAAEGTAILYISHKLEEIKTLCDGATILRLRQGGGDLQSARGKRAVDGRDDGRHCAAHAVARHKRGRARWCWISPGCGEIVEPVRHLAESRCDHGRSGRARCSGSAVLRATDRTSCSRRCRARSTAPPDAVKLAGGQSIGHLGPNARRGAWSADRT